MQRSASKIPPSRRFSWTHSFGVFVFCLIAQTLPAQAQFPEWPNEAQCQSRAGIGKDFEGWCIAVDRNRGNCIACHTFNISPWPVNLPVAGNIAPPLAAMAARFPDKAQLKSIIEDASSFNANTTMPPYLKHGILSPEDIELLVDFLHQI